MRVYGSASNPGAPGTWQRDVWFALNHGARVGRGTGRHRWRQKPPFHSSYGPGRRLLVTSGTPRLPYGRSTAGKGFLTHMPHTVLFAWHEGVLVGRMISWWCGARTAYFRLMPEPSSPMCVPCQFRMAQAVHPLDVTVVVAR